MKWPWYRKVNKTDENKEPNYTKKRMRPQMEGFRLDYIAHERLLWGNIHDTGLEIPRTDEIMNIPT